MAATPLRLFTSYTEAPTRDSAEVLSRTKPLIVTCLISTLVVMGVTGKVTELMVAVLKKKDAKGAGEEETV